MPVQVTIRMLSGEVHECCVPGGDTVRNLKVTLYHLTGMKPSRLRLLTTSGNLCEDEIGLLELVECTLADVLDPKVLRRSLFQLELHAVISSDLCSVCSAEFARRCSGCWVTRYCSRECQLHDWQDHKENCEARRL